MKNISIARDIELMIHDPRIRITHRRHVRSCLAHSATLQHARKTLEALAKNPDCRNWFH